MTWTNFKINIDHLIFTNEVLENALKQFFEEVMNKFSDQTYVKLLFRMEYENDMILTLGPQQK